MDRETRLAVFQELILNSHQLCYCCYTPDREMISSNMEASRLEGTALLLSSVGEEMIAYSKEGCYPFFLDSFLHVSWIADFEREAGKLQRIHVLGPTFTSQNSYQELLKKLDERELSIPLKHAAFKHIQELPVIANNIAREYAIMLHYCITGEHIGSQDFVFPSSWETTTALDGQKSAANEHVGIWASEQRFLAMIREGNPHYREALAASSALSYGVKHNAKDPIRQAKNNCITLLTLCSRAAIEGGMSPAAAYDLNDYYMQLIEDADQQSELNPLISSMMEDYVSGVRQSKHEKGVSKTIQNCCDYIAVHIKEPLSTKELAERTGYTEYYFSRKFKQETGYGIREYITKEKMERAKILLSSTNMSILEISLELSFSSRSYFSDTFQKFCGVSPKEYRNQSRKI